MTVTTVVAGLAVPTEPCAVWTRASGLSAMGSASYSPGGVILIPWPLPWPRDVRDIPELAEVVARAEAAGVRPLLALPVRADQQPVVCLYRATASQDRVEELARTERSCERDGIVAAAMELLDGAASDSNRVVVDLVVCTHGRRDRCCGSSGTRLAAEVGAAVPDSVRVWRSSHHGGHRFAPTALLLPNGTSWGNLDVDSALDVVHHRGDPSMLAERLRGSIAMEDSRLQMIDAAGFRLHGWEWLRAPRAHAVLRANHVGLTAELRTGTVRCEGLVAEREPVEVPPCAGSGKPTAHPVWEVLACRSRPVEPSPAYGQ